MPDTNPPELPSLEMTVHKAAVALISSIVHMAAMFWPTLTAIVSPELIALSAATVTPFLVWLVPNKVKGG